MTRHLLLAALVLSFAPAQAQAPKDLLFYGNSYSFYNLGVPDLVGLIAQEAGHPAPTIVSWLTPGADLAYHLSEPAHAAAITTGLTPGEEWDFVVMQGSSLEATVLGDPSAFETNALAILSNVRAHSANAGAVLYQTWARGPGSAIYPTVYSDPVDMHGDLRSSYRSTVSQMNGLYGAGTAFNAAAGDAVALGAFDTSLFDPDLSHPAAGTTLLAAMTVFQAIYRERVCDIGPSFTGGALESHLLAMGLTPTDWTLLAGIAERAADAELRRYPGSGEDFLLESSVNAAVTACPLDTAAIGDQINFRMSSPNGLYAGPAILVMDAFLTGNAPGPLLAYPEIHTSSPATVRIGGTGGLGGGYTFGGVLPESYPGFSVLIQGLALGMSTETGNALFAMTDAHEIVLQ